MSGWDKYWTINKGYNILKNEGHNQADRISAQHVNEGNYIFCI